MTRLEDIRAAINAGHCLDNDDARFLDAELSRLATVAVDLGKMQTLKLIAIEEILKS